MNTNSENHGSLATMQVSKDKESCFFIYLHNAPLSEITLFGSRGHSIPKLLQSNDGTLYGFATIWKLPIGCLELFSTAKSIVHALSITMGFGQINMNINLN